MRAEIITVGSELLLGQIVDSNAAFIARQLAAIGLDLHFKTTVGDNLSRLADTLRAALSRSQVVIVTGGIGPTADDVTREAVAEAMGRPLRFSPDLMAEIEAFFRARGVGLSPSNEKQAYIPEGARPLSNPVGTAPGFILEVGPQAVAVLPGVPREMEHLLITRVIPYLKDRYRLSGLIQSRILRVSGLGESKVGETLKDFMETGSNPTVGTMAHLGQVDVRIAAKGATEQEARALIAPVETEIRRRLADLVFGADGDTLEGVVVAALRSRRWRLAVIEAGSGGLLSARLHDAPEGSAVYQGGIVVPSVDRGLPPPLDQEGDDLTALVRKWFGVEVGVSVVIAQPGSDGSVVGRVRIAAPTGGAEKEYRFAGPIAQIRVRMVSATLDLIRRII